MSIPIAAELRGLDDLDISWTNVSGPGVDALLCNGRLGRLALAGLRVGPASIGAAENLRTLDLSETQVGDAAVSAMVALPRLERLGLAHTAVTSNGVIALADSTVSALDIRCIQLNEQALRAFSRMPRLRELRLSIGDRWEVDDTIARLSPLQRLRELNLFDSAVTDAVVPHVTALGGLRTLRLNSFNLSTSAATAIRLARPGLNVHSPAAPPDPKAAIRSRTRAFRT